MTRRPGFSVTPAPTAARRTGLKTTLLVSL
jgi:hypothetical protein